METRKLFAVPVVLLCLLSVSGQTSTECDVRTTTSHRDRALKIGVIIPRRNKFPWSLPLAGPGIQYALETVNNRTDFLAAVSNLTVTWGDSRCSDVYGPLVAFDMYVNESVDAFIGPGCDYAVAPIARFSAYWNKPVITGGALVHAFSDKSEYSLLTRISGSYDKLGVAIASLFSDYNWTITGMMYHNHLESRRLGKSTQFFIMEGIYQKLLLRFKYRYPDRQLWQAAFDENSQQKEMFFNVEALLKDASNSTRSAFRSFFILSFDFRAFKRRHRDFAQDVINFFKLAFCYIFCDFHYMLQCIAVQVTISNFLSIGPNASQIQTANIGLSKSCTLQSCI